MNESTIRKLVCLLKMQSDQDIRLCMQSMIVLDELREMMEPIEIFIQI